MLFVENLSRIPLACFYTHTFVYVSVIDMLTLNLYEIVETWKKHQKP
jgi:hypothetical protein